MDDTEEYMQLLYKFQTVGTEKKKNPWNRSSIRYKSKTDESIDFAELLETMY